jgi:hydrogenase/urease accessory protein HupE
MDAAALVTKLEATSADPLRAAPSSTAELTQRARALTPVLLDNVDLRFDSTRVRLTVDTLDIDGAGQAVVEMSGQVPAGARALTWSTSVVFGAYPLAVRRTGDEPVVRWLQGRETSAPLQLAGASTRFGPSLRGVWLGFTHILPFGIDHMLFVVGLFLLTARPRQLLLQVTAFTLAHSVTLALCLYGVVSVPSRLVEPLIALSVAYVGVENLFTSRLQPWRVAVVFAFGLLHGLGFAEAIAGLNLARADLLATLIAFNVGVELGQLTVIAGVSIAFFGLIRARHVAWRRPVAQIASAAVGITGLVWTVERLFL